MNLERSKSKAQLEVWQRNAFFVTLGGEMPGQDNRTIITLLFRNLSHRPTAVVDVYVREGEGILEGNGYKGRIKLPIKIEPWGVETVDFRIERADEKRMTNILVRDLEDNEIIVTRGRGQRWIKAKNSVQGQT